jgi:hypothetical protein
METISDSKIKLGPGSHSVDQPVRLLLAVLGDAQSANLTAQKAASIEKRGGLAGPYKITGFVLANSGGDRCIVEMSAVRWLSMDEMWWLMHDSQSPIFEPNDKDLARRALDSE